MAASALDQTDSIGDQKERVAALTALLDGYVGANDADSLKAFVTKAVAESTPAMISRGMVSAFAEVGVSIPLAWMRERAGSACTARASVQPRGVLGWLLAGFGWLLAGFG